MQIQDRKGADRDGLQELPCQSKGPFPVQRILLFCVLIKSTPCLSENDRQAILNDFLAFETILVSGEKEPCLNCYKD